MIYIQHIDRKITGYSEIKHYESDLLIDENTIDLEKISYYEVINGNLIYNASLLDEQMEKENKFFRLVELKQLLANTDYKVIKCLEAKELEEEMPYDLQALIIQRKAWREEINNLEFQISMLG